MTVQDSLCCGILVRNETLVLIERFVLDKSVKAFVEKQKSEYYNKSIFCTNLQFVVSATLPANSIRPSTQRKFLPKDLALIHSSESLHLGQ